MYKKHSEYLFWDNLENDKASNKLRTNLGKFNDNRNSYVNAKRSLKRALDKLKKLGVDYDEFNEHLLSEFTFPEIRLNNYPSKF